MSSNRTRNVSTDRLPLAVYAALAGFVLWMAIAAWGFASPDYADVTLTVVTGFLLVALAIPFILWRRARERGRQQSRAATIVRLGFRRVRDLAGSRQRFECRGRDHPASCRGSRRHDDIRRHLPLRGGACGCVR
jgi:membrane protein implicated in regulation of membrane protease activity